MPDAQLFHTDGFELSQATRASSLLERSRLCYGLITFQPTYIGPQSPIIVMDS